MDAGEGVLESDLAIAGCGEHTFDSDFQDLGDGALDGVKEGGKAGTLDRAGVVALDIDSAAGFTARVASAPESVAEIGGLSA